MLDAIRHFFHALFSPDGLRELIRAGGSPLICTIVFIETGFFVGFFLPGDSLLVTAGILSAGGVIPLKLLLLPVMLCAIVGDQIGYWIGRSAGAALYRREDSFFFCQPPRHFSRFRFLHRSRFIEISVLQVRWPETCRDALDVVRPAFPRR